MRERPGPLRGETALRPGQAAQRLAAQRLAAQGQTAQRSADDDFWFTTKGLSPAQYRAQIDSLLDDAPATA